MTPEEARQLLEGTTPGPWEWADCDDEGGGAHMALRNPAGEKAVITEDAESYQSGVRGTPADLRLTAAAPDMAAMIAGMRAEYSVRLPDGQLNDIGWGDYDAALEDKNTWRRYGFDAYIVRRYSTTPQPLGDEQ